MRNIYLILLILLIESSGSFGIQNKINETNTPIQDEDKSVPNTLTKKEQEEGWKLLFDGKTLNGWRRIYTEMLPAEGWVVEDGCMVVQGSKDGTSSNGGDMITVDQYDKFDLTLDFKLTEGANSGLKYYVNESLGGKGDIKIGYGYGLEFQLIDDNKNPTIAGGKPVTKGGRIGGLYELIDAGNKKVNPVGQWNTARIISDGTHVEHWLNGIKVVEYERGNSEFLRLVSESKFKNIKNYGLAPKGPILLQDHGNTVYFRNIKIRKLE